MYTEKPLLQNKSTNKNKYKKMENVCRKSIRNDKNGASRPLLTKI